MKTYALIGRNISYSFSRNYFSGKFAREGITDSQYINFDIQTLDELPALLKATPTLKGMNVTIPYKRDIISLLTAIEPTAHQIGAVNTIKPTPIGLIGYNTDYYGFTESLKPLLQLHHTQALILGTGGASGEWLIACSSWALVILLYHVTPKKDSWLITSFLLLL